jgi:hypothetical protein
MLKDGRRGGWLTIKFRRGCLSMRGWLRTVYNELIEMLLGCDGQDI